MGPAATALPSERSGAPSQEEPVPVSDLQSRVDLILDRLRVSPMSWREEIVVELCAVGDGVSPYLAGQFESIEADLRAHVASVLIRLKDKKAAPALKRLLSSKLPDVRAHAASILSTTTGATSAPWIRDMLRDPEPSVRAEAVAALHNVRDYKSFDAIARLCTDSDRRVRSAALRTCLAFSVKKPALAERLADVYSSAARWANAEAKVEVIEAMGTSGRKECLDLLTPYLGSPSPHLRAAAATAVSNLPGPAPGKALVESMNAEENEDVRKAMANAALKLRLDGAIGILIKWLEDTPARVRPSIGLVLRRLTNQKISSSEPAKWADWWANNSSDE